MGQVMKAAVIGCGRMGAQPLRFLGELPSGWHPLSHAESIQLVPGLTLAALCDIDNNNLKKLGKYYDVESLYQDYKQLIDEIKPDIITIATRTPEKGKIIKYACEHGVKGIYVEKPIANSLNDCLAIFETLFKYNVKLVYGVNKRYHPIYQKAKSLILEGKIGEVENVTVEFGRSLLMWSHPHSVDIIQYFLNTSDLQSIHAVMNMENWEISNSKIEEDPTLEHAYFIFNGGKTGTITSAGGFNTRIHGSLGNIVVHANGTYIEICRKNCDDSPYFLEHATLHEFSTQQATVFAISTLVDAIKENGILPIMPEEIIVGMNMLLGCVWSHMNKGKMIRIEEIPNNLFLHGMHAGLNA